ncbi:MAG: HEAT repeat domain-containing protein [Cyanobacteria bacterium]|nr:HEAT repeat domain-containing protein [Cyanobacteriota bacterium]
MTETDSVQTLIQAVEAADSAAGLVQAVRALAMVQEAAAIPTLIAVLGFNNPGAAVAAVDGLVQLGAISVPALLEQLDGYNYGARAWAIRALALIGDPRALTVLVETARGDFALSVRRAAAKGLGNIQWQAMVPEEAEPAQAAAQAALLVALQDPEWVVRYAAVVGLSGLVAAQVLGEEAAQACLAALTQCSHQDEETVVRARASWAIAQLSPP